MNCVRALAEGWVRANGPHPAALPHPAVFSDALMQTKRIGSAVCADATETAVARLGEEADYQSMQQFLTDSPWDPGLVVKAVAERVASEIDVDAG
jgi:hypothetical protein